MPEVEDSEEEVDDSIKDQIDCYRDRMRICGPDCVAWVTHPPENKGKLSFTQMHCLMLSTAERTARHVTLMAMVLGDIYKKNKTATADQQRKDAMGDNTKGGPFSDPFPITPKVQP